MSRRKTAIKRPVLADARYDSQTVSKFINVLMYQGKKSTARWAFSLGGRLLGTSDMRIARTERIPRMK